MNQQAQQIGPDASDNGSKSGVVYEVVSPNRYEVDYDAKKYIELSIIDVVYND